MSLHPCVIHIPKHEGCVVSLSLVILLAAAYGSPTEAYTESWCRWVQQSQARLSISMEVFCGWTGWGRVLES